MLKKICVFCCNEGLDQGFGHPFLRNRDPIVHQEFSDHLIVFRIDDGISIEIPLLERLKVRKMVGVVEKKESPEQQRHEERKDEGNDEIESPSFPSSSLGPFWG